MYFILFTLFGIPRRPGERRKALTHMTDKQFRRLNRSDLIEIIYELQQSEKLLRLENEQLKQQLEQQRAEISQADSMAELLEKLNGLLAAARTAQPTYEDAPQSGSADAQLLFSQALRSCEQADAYMADIKRKAAKLGAIALQQYDEMLAKAEEDCRKLREDCEEELRQSHEELQRMLTEARCTREQADAYMEAVESKTVKPDCDNIPTAEAEDRNGSLPSVQEG